MIYYGTRYYLRKTSKPLESFLICLKYSIKINIKYLIVITDVIRVLGIKIVFRQLVWTCL